MAALTLVMKELADFDPEEFLNVRIFCSGSKELRQVLRRPRPSSPTNSESSGISSLTTSSISSSSSSLSSSTYSSSSSSSSTADGEAQIIKAKSERDPKINCITKLPKTFEPVQVIKEIDEEQDTSNEDQSITSNKDKNIRSKERKSITSNDRILYCGRDILNMERNTQPYKWQLTSPLLSFLDHGIPYKYRTYFRFNCDFMKHEYLMCTCMKCGFRQPLPIM